MAYSKKAAPRCDTCPYRKNCLYDFLDQKKSKQEWKELRIASHFKDGENIFHEGTKPPGLYVVCRGHAKVYKTSRTGEQLLVRIENPGDLLGHISLLVGGAYAGSAESMGESVVSLIDQDKFFRFLRQTPDASIALLKALSLDVRRGEDKARDIAYKPARARLATILLDLVKTNENGNGNGSILNRAVFMKRKELAEMAGLTPETITRVLKDFEQRNLIKKQKDSIVVLNTSTLEPLAELHS